MRVHLLMSSPPCIQEVPPTEPVEAGDEGELDTMGEPAGSRSPAPTIEELIAQLERQPPARRESTGPAAPAVEQVVAVGAWEEAPVEGGLVDIASILGAPAAMIVRSSL
jgi:hypothetical protein